MIDSKLAQEMVNEIKERKDLTQVTFENNEIRDPKGVSNFFKNLNYEKIEQLNLRCNQNFDEDVVKALAEGIKNKKELRVSSLPNHNPL